MCNRGSEIIPATLSSGDTLSNSSKNRRLCHVILGSRSWCRAHSHADQNDVLLLPRSQIHRTHQQIWNRCGNNTSTRCASVSDLLRSGRRREWYSVVRRLHLTYLHTMSVPVMGPLLRTVRSIEATFVLVVTPVSEVAITTEHKTRSVMCGAKKPFSFNVKISNRRTCVIIWCWHCSPGACRCELQSPVHSSLNPGTSPERFERFVALRVSSQLFAVGAMFPTSHLDSSNGRPAGAGCGVVVQKPSVCTSFGTGNGAFSSLISLSSLLPTKTTNNKQTTTNNQPTKLPTKLPATGHSQKKKPRTIVTEWLALGRNCQRAPVL